MIRILACVLLLGARAATAQGFVPGHGAVVAGGGAAAGSAGAPEAGFLQVAAVGQPGAGPAATNAWAFRAGFLALLPEPGGVSLSTAPPVSATPGNPIAIAASVVSTRPVGSVTLRYRAGGQTSYVSVPMIPGGSGFWGAEIPGDDVALRGVEYFVEARLNGRPLRSPASGYSEHPWRVPVCVSESSGNGALATAARAYRMISFPASLPNGSPLALLTDDLGPPDTTAWRCGRWDPVAESYRQAGRDPIESFAPGRAAWLVTREAASIDFSGQSVFAPDEDGWRIPLSPGWNQIGNPFAYEVALASVLVDDGSRMYTFSEAVGAGLLEAHPLHTYTGTGYRTENSGLAPYTGYFVANTGNAAVDLVIPPREDPEAVVPPARNGAESASEPSCAASLSREPDWLLRLSAHAPDGAALVLEVGSAAGSVPALDAWDRLQPPAAPGLAVAAGVRNPDLPARVHWLQRDVRPPDASGLVWTVHLSAPGPCAVPLAWETPSGLPPGHRAQLMDLDSGARIDLSSRGGHMAHLAAAGTAYYRIAVGLPDWLDEEAGGGALPEGGLSASLLGGNPSREGFRVRLSLRHSDQVRLEVYDVAGRMVRTLAQQEKAAGVHAVLWDGTTDDGLTAPTGVYFLRLSGRGSATTVRGVLLR